LEGWEGVVLLLMLLLFYFELHFELSGMLIICRLFKFSKLPLFCYVSSRIKSAGAAAEEAADSNK